MENTRLILVMALAFVLLLMYQAWHEDYPPTPTVVSSTGVTSTKTPDTSIPSAPSIPESSELPSVGPSSAIELPIATTARLLNTKERIHITTDVLQLEIDTIGGDIRKINLINYPVAVKTPEQPFELLNDQLPNVFVAQSGLLPETHAPTHKAIYQADKLNYKLEGDTLEVKLRWQSDKPISVDKIYTFQRGSYIVNVKHVLNNKSDKPWKGRLYGQFQRTETTLAGDSKFLYTYMGGAISSPDERYEKISFSDIKDGDFNRENRNSWEGGWIAMLQHYFVSAWIPVPEQQYKYYTNLQNPGSRHILGLYGPEQTVAPYTKQEFKIQFFAGPKLQDKLAELSPNLDLTVDYGWLWFIAQPLFALLQIIHDLIGNWGWSIIILTVMIKIVFFKLSATSYKSMANMRRLQPRLVSLKERYGDDKSRLNQAMMDMYRKEKINPLGGCLPIAVQIPVFIALYWVLLESVELRQADFIFWLNDLSSPDPFFILPLIMGATMFMQHRLNPAPIDPIQQKIMLVLPVVFTVFFAFFPSGLVLYWVVNNILSIGQQWVITKKIAGNI
ncbi:MAG: membrane protein insertase YidC [Proteobacteria bacterium]|nr:membrane protein insertase YidC [Pseudomonadota bacterium]